MISCKEQDFLDEDPRIRGQNFVCLSFINPEDVIKKKESFLVEKFLSSFSDGMNEFIKELQMKYPDEGDILDAIKERYNYVFDNKNINSEYKYFVETNGDELEKEYLEEIQSLVIW